MTDEGRAWDGVGVWERITRRVGIKCSVLVYYLLYNITLNCFANVNVCSSSELVNIFIK